MVGSAMAVAVVSAVIGAAGTVLGAWVQGRARGRRSRRRGAGDRAACREAACREREGDRHGGRPRATSR